MKQSMELKQLWSSSSQTHKVAGMSATETLPNFVGFSEKFGLSGHQFEVITASEANYTAYGDVSAFQIERERQTDRQTDRQMNKQMDGWTNRQNDETT